MDLGLAKLSRLARLLPALTAQNAASERARLVAMFERGQRTEPRWERPEPRTSREARPLLLTLRGATPRLGDLAAGGHLQALYEGRLDELELELDILAALGETKLVRPLAARRYGTGRSPAPNSDLTLYDVASDLLARNPPKNTDPPVVPAAAAPGATSLAGLVRDATRLVGIGDEAEIVISRRLTSNAAAGDRTVFIADRSFGEVEARRLAVHEVYGHLVSAFNGRTQPLGICAQGTAGSFGDQEGLAIALEERAGLIDGPRVRTLAGRVLVSAWVHDGASFAEAVDRLMTEHGFSALHAVVLAERGFRGGGVTRDVVYLRSWIRVRNDQAALRWLRVGKLALRDVPALPELAAAGWINAAPPYSGALPSFASSSRPTGPGTSLEISPPSLHTSFTRRDAT